MNCDQEMDEINDMIEQEIHEDMKNSLKEARDTNANEDIQVIDQDN